MESDRIRLVPAPAPAPAPSPGPAPQRARQDSGSGPAPGPGPQVRQEPLFHSVPPRPQRLLHSEAYIKYIEVSQQKILAGVNFKVVSTSGAEQGKQEHVQLGQTTERITRGE